MEISVWIADADTKLEEKALARALADLSTKGVLFDVLSINRGSSDQAQKQFRGYQGDAFVVLDAQMMLGKSPKYNASLSTFKDQDLSDESIIIDPMEGLDVQRPRFVQIDGSGNSDIAAYRIEATIGLIEFSKLWQSQAYKQYALSTGQADLTPQLKNARHAIMDECILPAWKPR